MPGRSPLRWLPRPTVPGFVERPGLPRSWQTLSTRSWPTSPKGSVSQPIVPLRGTSLAKGSCNEARSHLEVATIRGGLAEGDCRALQRQADEISRMLTGLARYLLKSDRKQRL